MIREAWEEGVARGPLYVVGSVLALVAIVAALLALTILASAFVPPPAP